ncbi:MAG: (2Fe-2S)-binding protein [Alphaproteobacteria bacterium]|nr:(2Fe-2S)-binding protein [Alphaproteobacteria bacterium]
MARLTINGKGHDLDVEGEMPLLWVLRDELNLTGTKFGCGAGLCGACTVTVDGEATRSCITTVESVEGTNIRTIETLADAGTLSAVQQAWVEHQVPQCGYCQPGFIMATSALLDQTPDPSDDEIDEALTNICRCGTYERIRAAVRRAAQLKKSGGQS